jgi:ferredoxin--NADP+ reductase
MMEDLEKGAMLQPAHPEASAAEKMVRDHKPSFFSYDDWLRLNEIEVSKGKKEGKPRVKFTRVEDMLAALGR